MNFSNYLILLEFPYVDVPDVLRHICRQISIRSNLHLTTHLIQNRIKRRYKRYAGRGKTPEEEIRSRAVACDHVFNRLSDT